MTYLHNDVKTFEDAIMLTYEQTGLIPQAIEKDFYVTMLLQLLSQKMPYIVFKGGTSLSKCHKVIQRFSEDIDITIDTLLTQGQKKKVKQAIVDSVTELNMTIDNLEDTRSRRDYNRYIISYNSVLPLTSQKLYPAVLLETSYTAVSFPTIVLPVHSYIGDMLKTESPKLLDKFMLSPFRMKVQGTDRTLIDKIFALCDYYLQDKIARHSRHLYDIYKLLPLVPLDDNFRSLIYEVRNLRAVSPVCPSANSNISISKLLCQIIEKQVYKTDYDTITIGLLDEKVPYDTVINALLEIIKSNIFE